MQLLVYKAMGWFQRSCSMHRMLLSENIHNFRNVKRVLQKQHPDHAGTSTGFSDM